MQGVQIDPVDTVEPPYKAVNIDENLSFGFLPNAHNVEIWTRLYKETNTPLF